MYDDDDVGALVHFFFIHRLDAASLLYRSKSELGQPFIEDAITVFHVTIDAFAHMFTGGAKNGYARWCEKFLRPEARGLPMRVRELVENRNALVHSPNALPLEKLRERGLRAVMFHDAPHGAKETALHMKDYPVVHVVFSHFAAALMEAVDEFAAHASTDERVAKNVVTSLARRTFFISANDLEAHRSRNEP